MKTISKNLKSAGMFGSWLLIAAICIACIFAGIGGTGFMSSIIMATLLLMPVRDGLVRLIVWGIQYIFSINPTVKKKLSPYFIVDNLDPTGDKKVLDKGALNAIKWSVAGLCAVIALFFFAFQGISSEVIYTFLHNVSVFFGYFADGMGFIPFLWIIASVVSVVFTFMTIKAVFGGVFGQKHLIFLGYIVVKHIANYFVFKYTFMMVLWDIIGIVVLFGLIALAAFLSFRRMRTS